MTTLTIRISDEQKRLIKAKAAFQGKTITDFVLEATGVAEKRTSFTTNQNRKIISEEVLQNLQGTDLWEEIEESHNDKNDPQLMTLLDKADKIIESGDYTDTTTWEDFLESQK